MSAVAAKLQKVTVSMMNAIHDLPLLVARDEGFFGDEGLDVEILKTPGSGSSGPTIRRCARTFRPHDGDALRPGPMRPVPHVRMGRDEARRRIDDREGTPAGEDRRLRLGHVVLRARRRPETADLQPEQLKNKPIAVSPYNGSHFTTLKLLDGFLTRDQIKTVSPAPCASDRGGEERRGRGGKRDGAVDQRRREAGNARHPGNRIRRGARRRATSSTGLRSARCSAPRPAPPPRSTRTLAATRITSSKNRAGSRDQGREARAHPQRAARALHARAVRPYLQLDPRLGPGAARRHLRERRRQPRLAIAGSARPMAAADGRAPPSRDGRDRRAWR